MTGRLQDFPRLRDDLSLALAVAAEADLVSLARFQAQDLIVETKPDRTPVTDADRAVERTIRDRIGASRPGDSIRGEEYGVDGDASRQWIIDPIDGTAAFLRGVPTWGTLIALAIDGTPVVGVVSCPALGRRWWAARGHGAWTGKFSNSANPLASTADASGAARISKPQPLTVSRVGALSDASFSYNNLQGWDGAGRAQQLLEISREVWRARSIGDVWSYMLLAEGSLDAVAEFDLKPYDIAAIVPIVEEAGGTFTDADGTPGPWGGSALATNGPLHEAMLSKLRR